VIHHRGTEAQRKKNRGFCEVDQLLLLLPLVAAAAGEDRQVDWVGDFDKAFELAKERKCPVMVCINSKDREKANDKTAKDIYKDPEFVALSKSFVMVVMSTITHKAAGTCPRFGIVTCEEHLHCWQVLAAKYGDRFVSDAAHGDMITPQHAWFSPDGTLLARKEYWMDKRELLQRMQRALEDVSKEKEKGPGEEVVVEGRISNVVKGFATFNLVDAELYYCGKGQAADECKTPWDYCCVDAGERAAATLSVDARGADGKVLAGALPGLRLLDLVVVKGRLEKDDHGNVTVVATGWFTRERPELPDDLHWPE